MESYLNGIKEELDTVKNNDQFYLRLDQLVSQLSKLCPNGGAIRDEKLEFVTRRILREHQAAFVELAKGE